MGKLFKKRDGVIAYSYQVNTISIFSNSGINEQGMLVGIDPAGQAKINFLDKKIIKGNYDSLSRGTYSAIAGEKIAKKLGIEVGNYFLSNVPGTGQVELKLTGIFFTGYRFLDEETIYVSLNTIKAITKKNDISALTVRLEDPMVAGKISQNWKTVFTDKIQSWDETNAGLMNTFRTMKIAAGLVSLTIVLVASFGIYSILNITVSQKKREIAILKTIGYPENYLVILFAIQGAIPGFIGGILGLLLGYLSSLGVEQIPIAQSEGVGKMAFAITHFLVSYNYRVYILSFVISFTVSTIAAIVPAMKASRLSPISIIRGEI